MRRLDCAAEALPQEYLEIFAVSRHTNVATIVDPQISADAAYGLPQNLRNMDIGC